MGSQHEYSISLPGVRRPLDMTGGFLIDLLYRKFGRRLAIGCRDKIISNCSARCSLGDRVAMRDHSRRIIILILAIAVSNVVPASFPTRVEARDPVAGVAVPEDYSLGGEPGEDPHLKVKPAVQPVKDPEPLGCYGGGGAGGEDEYIINAEGIREGRGYGLGSRVNPAWRMILWVWLWQLHR